MVFHATFHHDFPTVYQQSHVWSPSIATRSPTWRPGIENLPIEIFTEIIKIVVQDSTTTPIAISHVCKQWQHVIHNNPFFWDVLVLTGQRPKAKAKFWMDKSRGRLKELSVKSSAVGTGKTKAWADLLRDVAWDYLRVLRVEKWQVVKFLNNNKKLESLKNIETLEIDNSNPLESFPSWMHSSKQSKLRNLVILASPIRTTPFQVQDLTSLSLSNVKRPQECLAALLMLNPLLEYLSLSCVSYGHVDTNRVTMVHLKFLRLENSFPSVIFAIDMPNLETIQIENQHILSSCEHGLHRYSMDAMRTPLGHTRLTKLILRNFQTIGPNYPGEGSGIISLLQASPNLERLEISRTAAFKVNFVIEVLASTYSPFWESIHTVHGIPICPNLSHVDFSGCSRLETGPLLRMVKSRLATQITSPTQPIQGHGDIEDEDEDPTPTFQSKQISSLILDSCPHLDPGWVEWLIYRAHCHVSWNI